MIRLAKQIDKQMRFFLLKAIICGFITISFTGCFDSKMKLAGNYYLEDVGESRKSIIVSKSGEELIGGVFGGNVIQLGWNEKYILAFVEPHYKGDVSGWYLLEVTSGNIHGPLSENEMEKYAELKPLSSVEVLSGKTP